MAKKIILGIVIGLLVLIIVVALVVGLSLGKIVKAGIETVGPKLTQTTITLDAVDLSLLTGSVKIKGLVVGNPEGYKAPQAISVGLVAVSVSPMSVFSDRIVVKSIKVEAPEITFEGSPLAGNNNFSKIRNNLNAATKSGSTPFTNQTATAAGKPAQKIEVDDFLINDAKVHFNGLTLPLPPVHLTDLGKGTDGITAADLSKRVFSELTSAIIKAVTSSAADVGKSVENLGKGATQGAAGGVDKIKKGLGGLFGK